MADSTVTSSKSEMIANATEDNLLCALKSAMQRRGLTILGFVAVDAEGSLAAIGDKITTQSAEFAEILRCLADQIDLNKGVSPEWWIAARRPQYEQ